MASIQISIPSRGHFLWQPAPHIGYDASHSVIIRWAG